MLRKKDPELKDYIYRIKENIYGDCDCLGEQLEFYVYDFLESLINFSKEIEKKYPGTLKIKVYDYNRLKEFYFIEDEYFKSLLKEREVLLIIKFLHCQYNMIDNLINHCQVVCDEAMNILIKELQILIKSLDIKTIKIIDEYDVMIKVEEFVQKYYQLEDIILIKDSDFNNYQYHLALSRDWSWYQEKCKLIKFNNLYEDFKLYDALKNYVIDKVENLLPFSIKIEHTCLSIKFQADIIKNSQLGELLFNQEVLRDTVTKRYFQYQKIIQTKLLELTSVVKYMIERYGDIFRFEKEFIMINSQVELLDVKKTACLKALYDSGKLTEFIKLDQKLNHYIEKMISEQILHKKYKDIYRLIVDSDHLKLDTLNDYLWRQKYSNELIDAYYNGMVSYQLLEDLGNALDILIELIDYCQKEYQLVIKFDSMMQGNIERLLKLSTSFRNKKIFNYINRLISCGI